MPFPIAVASAAPCSRSTRNPIGPRIHMTSGQVKGAVLLQMLQAGRLWLGRHREFLNDQNVYPVPDGDTGSNMWLTLDSAWQAVSNESPDSPCGELWNLAAQGALAGSRGNSGVILSQYMRGMAESMGTSVSLNGEALRHALQKGSEKAYAAVSDPQEGTILTVARDVANAAKASTQADTVESLLQLVLPVALTSVERTPKLLPVLKDAGVVDAGGLGLAYFLEGLLKGLQGQEIIAVEMDESSAATRVVKQPISEIPELVYGFDVQFLAHQPRLSLARMRSSLNSMGEFGLVEGTPEMVKVHVHVPDPGPVLSWGCSIGFLTDVVVENMDEMAAAKSEEICVASQAIPDTGLVRLVKPAAREEKAVVAVTSSRGFSELFASLGVHCLIECRETLNPSVQQFKEAVEKTEAAHVILLPNHENAIAAAVRAQEAFPNGRVAVIHTQFIVNGVTAMYGFEQAQSWPELLSEMTALATDVLFGSVAKATRDVQGIQCKVAAGEFVAMGHGKDVIGGGPQLSDAVSQLMKRFLLTRLAREDAADFSLLTVYKGADLKASDEETVAAEVRRFLPQFEIEWVDSRQKHHWLLIVAE